MEIMGQVPNPFGPRLSQNRTYRNHPYSIGQPIEPLGFPTWAQMEKCGSGSKPLWFQFGPFETERCVLVSIWQPIKPLGFPTLTKMEK